MIGVDLAAERAAFRDTLVEVGPDVAGVCGEWTSEDLAVHVALGELAGGALTWGARDLIGRGVRIDRLAGPNASALRVARRRRDWSWALDRLDSAPPPLLRGGQVAVVSLLEVWSHHEDLLVAVDATPCRSGVDLTDVLRLLVRYQRGPLAELGASVGGPDGRWWHGGPDDRVRVTGTDVDVARWLSGRPGADLIVEGDTDAVADVEAARLTL